MAQVGKVLKCEKCGNVVVVIKEGGNPKVHCCDQEMVEQQI